VKKEPLTVFILSAGLGTRLGTLTSNKPKALVKVGSLPMIDRLLINLSQRGFGHFVINLHHHADLLENHLKQNFPDFDIKFSNERNELLDTGGAIIHAKNLLLSNDFLIHNVDIIMPCKLFEMLEIHRNNKAMFTLAVSDRNSSRKLLFTKDGFLCGWKNLTTGELKKNINFTDNHIALSYSGVQWVSSDYFSIEERKGKFSIIDAWLEISNKHPVVAFEHSSNGWYDMGTEQLICKVETELF